MKNLILGAVLAAVSVLTQPSLARVPDYSGTAVTQPAVQPDSSNLIEHDHYANKDGERVHSPAHTRNGKVPRAATARCKDGSYSFSRHHRGTCSGHHGVAMWMQK